MRASRLAVIVIISVGLAVTAVSASGQAKSKPAAERANNADKYKEARDLIRRARTLLGDFVNENPTADDAYFARLQLAALENIFKTDVPIVPVKLRDDIVWRVVGIENRESDTKITIELENPTESGEEYIYQFGKYPLVLIANKKAYAMKKGAIKAPSGIQRSSDSDYWYLQSTQVVRVDVFFDALDDGVLEGVVKYASDRDEKSARFSMMNINQNSP